MRFLLPNVRGPADSYFRESRLAQASHAPVTSAANRHLAESSQTTNQPTSSSALPDAIAYVPTSQSDARCPRNADNTYRFSHKWFWLHTSTTISHRIAYNERSYRFASKQHAQCSYFQSSFDTGRLCSRRPDKRRSCENSSTRYPCKLGV